MKVSRPGSLVGLSLPASAIASSAARGRAELDADRVLDVAEQLDVGAVELAGALADPDEVAGDVVRQLGAAVDAGHRVLVLEDQRLVAGVEVDPVELVGVGADRLHEGQRAVDLGGHLLVAAADRGAEHEVGVPGVHLAQVGVPTGDEGAHEVQRRGRRVVDLHEPLRVGDARGLGGEVEAVDGVAAVGRQGDAVAGLEVRGARLGVLAGEPAQLHDGHRRGVRQHDGHLQQHAQLVAGVVGGHAVEGLGAVAALEQEGLAARRPRPSLSFSSSHSPAKTSGGIGAGGRQRRRRPPRRGTSAAGPAPSRAATPGQERMRTPDHATAGTSPHRNRVRRVISRPGGRRRRRCSWCRSRG